MSALPMPPSSINATASASSPSKKRRLELAMKSESDADEPSSPDTCPSSSKPGPRKSTDPERRARLEARQARNRLSAQYSRERKKAYMDELENSVSTLKSENSLLRQQREQDAAVRKALEGKLQTCESRISSLETLIRNLAHPSTSASPGSFTLDPSVSALLQDVNDVHKSGTSCTTVAAPASIPSLSPSSDISSSQTLDEDVRLPAVEATCSDAPSLRDAELEQSQQRTSLPHPTVLMKQVSLERIGLLSMSMAAASSPTRPDLSTILTVPQLSRSRPTCLKLKVSFPSSSTSPKLVSRRRLLLRIKVPRRLPQPLMRYLLARSLRSRQSEQQQQQTSVAISTVA